MTKATAATVAQALVNAGYQVQVTQTSATTYKVSADSAGAAIAASAVSTFATTNGVTGQVYAAEFV